MQAPLPPSNWRNAVSLDSYGQYYVWQCWNNFALVNGLNPGNQQAYQSWYLSGGPCPANIQSSYNVWLTSPWYYNDYNNWYGYTNFRNRYPLWNWYGSGNRNNGNWYRVNGGTSEGRGNGNRGGEGRNGGGGNRNEGRSGGNGGGGNRNGGGRSGGGRR